MPFCISGNEMNVNYSTTDNNLTNLEYWLNADLAEFRKIPLSIRERLADLELLPYRLRDDRDKVKELKYTVDEIEGREAESKGLSNGTYKSFLPPRDQKRTFTIPNVVGCEVYTHDTVVVRQGFKRPKDWVDPIRTEITEFSAHSRQRLAFIANNTPIEFQSMITLTYPHVFPTDGFICKWHLDRFREALEREFGKFEYLWFDEWQKRGALHFHLQIDIDIKLHGDLVAKWRHGGKKKYITVESVHQWASKTWTRIIHKELKLYRDNKGVIYNKQDDNGGRELVAYWQPDMTLSRVKDSYRSGISFEPIRERDGARHYVVKYATKMEQKIVPPNFTHVGRFWGCSKAVRDIKPVAKLVTTEPMLKTVLGALDGVHEAVKKLVKLPRVLFNVGRVFCQEIDTVKEVLIPMNEFRQHIHGFNKPVELREIRADQIMRVFQKMGFSQASDAVDGVELSDFDRYCLEMEGQY
jgi:hypothetical protein